MWFWGFQLFLGSLIFWFFLVLIISSFFLVFELPDFLVVLIYFYFWGGRYFCRAELYTLVTHKTLFIQLLFSKSNKESNRIPRSDSPQTLGASSSSAPGNNLFLAAPIQQRNSHQHRDGFSYRVSRAPHFPLRSARTLQSGSMGQVLEHTGSERSYLQADLPGW